MSLQTARSNFTLYPFAWLALGFALGIVAENSFEISWQIHLLISLVCAATALIFIRRRFAVVLLAAAFAASGALCFQVEKKTVAPNRLKVLYDEKIFVSGDPIEITGVLRGKPESAVGGFFLEMKAESAIYKGEEKAVAGVVRLFAPATDRQIADEYANLSLRYGTRIRIACNLRREEKFQNAGVVSSRKILDQKEIDASATIKSPLLIENLGEVESFAPIAWIFEQRQNLIEEFRTHFSTKTAGILIASQLGNRYFLDKETSERFREGGTFHVLVISGLQITFIGGLAIFVLRLFTRNRFLQFVLATAFLWSYSLAVGADAPVIRAALMFTILLFARVIFRQMTLLNSLGAAALALLLWRPSDLFDQSFQLTFMCVTAIVAMAFPLLEKLRAIGEWSPSSQTPVPPACGKNLRVFCEALYWSEKKWQFEQSQNVWSCRLFKSPLAEKIESAKLQKILRFVFETLAVSVIVQAWLVPFLVIYFHRVSLAGIFLNVWAGLLTAIESLTAISAIFFAQISYALAAPFILVTEILNWIILHASDWFIEIGWASLRIPQYSGAMRAVYVLYFAPVILLTLLLHGWRPFDFKLNRDAKAESEKQKTKAFDRNLQMKIAASSFLIFLFVIIFHPFSAPSPDGRLRVEFLDVGQGDAALLTMPTGETLLIEGGGKMNFSALYIQREGEDPEPFEPDTSGIGERVVSEFLWEKGYSKVDFILATHADADHIQGLSDVAKNFRVRTAIFGKTAFDDEDFKSVYNVLEKKGVPVYIASRGDVLEFGGVKIEILHPESEESETPVSNNNNSIVLRVRFGERKFLLTGDIEKETERILLGSPEFLQADVVKVAHHGSQTSSTEDFVKATKAKAAIISVGRDSPFGHPKVQVTERWKKSGAKVLTTGENGTISFSTDGKDLQMKTFSKPVIYR